ncbi:sialidase family protein [Herbiconiux sp. P17]|uniref:sialidase family protein n=1 Tax=Herbiconiux wuyangfengii TaxID=3342794 RepID=UPI0035B89F2C
MSMPSEITVISSGSAGEAPAMFPAAARTPEALVVAYSTVPDGWPGGEVHVTRSTDNGSTWTPPLIVAVPVDGEDAALGALGLTRLSDGTLLLPYNGITWTPGMGTEGRQSILRLKTSTDAGLTWQGGERIEVGFDWPAVYGEILEFDDGELLWPVWGCQVVGEKWRSSVLNSHDHGRTWAVKSTIAFDPTAHLTGDYVETGNSVQADDPSEISDPTFRPHDSTDGFTETSVCELADGRLLAVLRQQGVDGDQTLLFFRSYSSDRGASWTPYESLGFPGMSPAVVGLADGRLLLAYRRSAPDDSDEVPGVEVRIGDAAGARWGEPVLLADPNGTVLTAEYQCGYPAIVTDGDDFRVFFYSFEPEQGRYIAWNRISVT